MRSFVDWSFAYYDQVIKAAKLKGVGRLATKEPSTSEDVPLQLHHKMRTHRVRTHKKSPKRTVCAFIVIADQS